MILMIQNITSPSEHHGNVTNCTCVVGWWNTTQHRCLSIMEIIHNACVRDCCKMKSYHKILATFLKAGNCRHRLITASHLQLFLCLFYKLLPLHSLILFRSGRVVRIQ
jgi:hypothetical protein